MDIFLKSDQMNFIKLFFDLLENKNPLKRDKKIE